MKIATLTWYHYRNYGTALQAVALTKVLEEMGYSPEMIKYEPIGYFRTIPNYGFSRMLGRLLCRKRLYEKKENYISDERDRKYEAFLNNNLHFTKKCETKSDLENLNEEYDAFVCGSDQIWSPLAFNSKYYLDFVKSAEKKIAYAPSMGTDKIEDEYIKKEISRLLKEFGTISVREESGKKLVEQLSGKEAEVVLDPTLLLSYEQWITKFDMKKTLNQKPYLLVYMLGSNEKYWAKIYDAAKFLKLDVKIIPVFKDDIKREGIIEECVGPYEFLQLFYNAKYVCTDSFHGIIFCHKFHIPFTVFSRFEKRDKNNQNTRIDNLLNITGLKERLYQKDNHIKMLNQAVEFDKADKELDKMIESSKEFLKNVLDGIVPSEQNYVAVGEQNSLCSGCGACSNVCPTKAIKIQMNENGFWHAFVNKKKCIHCGKCISVCAFCKDTKNIKVSEAELFSYKCDDDKVLRRSTSGGAAYCLSKHLIKKGYAIVACKYNEYTQRAEHVVISDEEGLLGTQGSKYIPSDFSSVLPDVLKLRRPIAFFGTPCQIAAAKRILSDKSNAIYIDLVCHGVPSYNLYAKYQNHIHKEYGIDINKMKMSFRYKPKGWSTIHLHAEDGENEYCCTNDKDLFFRMFEVGNCYNETCYECRWRVDSEADIRLADYWGPKFKEDFTGVNMVICFSERGKQLVNVLNEYGNLKRQPIEDYLNYQQSLNLPKPLFYDELMNELKKENIGLQQIVDKYAVPLENKKMSRAEHVRYTAKMMFRRKK